MGIRKPLRLGGGLCACESLAKCHLLVCFVHGFLIYVPCEVVVDLCQTLYLRNPQHATLGAVDSDCALAMYGVRGKQIPMSEGQRNNGSRDINIVLSSGSKLSATDWPV